VIAMLVHAAVGTCLFKLASALLRLTAALTVPPDRLMKVRFSLPNALFTSGIACLQGHHPADQEKSAEYWGNQSAFSKHAVKPPPRPR
jgi:hypothetical protein